jgi:enoyl-CoA hydratase/carnithine racemase
MGMVNHLVESDRLESFAYEMAKEILACAPLSLRGSKFILNRIAGQSAVSEEDLETFQSMRLQAVQSEDHQEAKRAFMEKRKARFKAR